MHSALYTVRIISDPHIGIFVHHSACGIEDVIVISYLCEALGAYTIDKIESLSVTLNKAVLYELAVGTESVPASSIKQLGSHINFFIYRKYSVYQCIIVLAVKLIETLWSERLIYHKIELTVFFNYFLLAVFNIRKNHFAGFVEVVHSAFNSVRIISDPHIGIFIHHSACGIEDIVVIAYLCEALGKCSVIIIIGKSFVLDKAVYNHSAVGIKLIGSLFYGKPVSLCYPIAAVSDYFCSRCSCIIVASVNHYESLADLDAVDIIELRTVSVADAVL